MGAKVFVVIPSYDYWAQTRRCLESFAGSGYRDIKIIVVDHGATDETKKGLEKFPQVMRIAADTSLWWTGATNVGIRAALQHGAQAIMLLNADCCVSPDTVQTLLRHQAANPGAVIAPLQRDMSDRSIFPYYAVTCFAFGFPTLMLPVVFRHQKKPLVPVRLILGGRGVLIPAQVLARLGLLDEETLPHYGSDHDFYLRCRRNGIPLFVATDAEVYVDNSRTTLASAYGNMSWRQFRESLQDRRSHRNLRDLAALFKRYYPIKGLHYVGIALNLIRYALVYVWYRAKNRLMQTVAGKPGGHS